MKKITLTVAVAVLTLAAGNAMAQDKTAAEVTTTVQSKENAQKEADALEKRIKEYTIKVEANKDRIDDYEGELKRIAGLKSKWEGMTGKTWKEEEK